MQCPLGLYAWHIIQKGKVDGSKIELLLGMGRKGNQKQAPLPASELPRPNSIEQQMNHLVLRFKVGC